jgi:hypothetical protein
MAKKEGYKVFNVSDNKTNMQRLAIIYEHCQLGWLFLHNNEDGNSLTVGCSSSDNNTRRLR